MIFIKKIVLKILSSFSLGMYNLKSQSLIPKKFWIPDFDKNNNDFYRLYYKGLKISGSEWTDNFPKQLRFFSLYQIAKHILKSNLKYDFAECGCWYGHSTFMISKIIENSKNNINFHIFDSFEGGLSNLQDEDSHLVRKLSNKEIYNQKILFASDENFVKNVLKQFDFTKIYKGWIPDRFDEVKEKKFQFVHIDVDLYQPTLESLKFFFDRVVHGGCIICDDYNLTQFPGAKKAWDEYFIDKKVSFFYESPYGGCFIIK